MSDSKSGSTTEPAGTGSGRGGMHFGGETVALWGKSRTNRPWRLEGNKLVHTNGNRCVWNVERGCWVSA